MSETPKSGIELIVAERQRQMDVEGWTPRHDDNHTESEIVGAALCYASIAGQQARGESVDMAKIVDRWPWERSWLKPSADPIRNLVKAGALIAAEIDRLQREAAHLAERTDRPE